MHKYLKIKGYDVTVCNDGKAGLDFIKNGKWDKILLDLAIPNFSGFDIIESLEKNNILKDKEILLFTASSIPESTIEKLLEKDGIKGCMKKPLSLTNVTHSITA